MNQGIPLIRTTAILVDGGFYRKKARTFFGKASPKVRAQELYGYCQRHLRRADQNEIRDLHRIFYYDGEPVHREIWHPFKKEYIDIGKNWKYEWSKEFFRELRTKRKVALRLGEQDASHAQYQLSAEAMSRLCEEGLSLDQLKETDFQLTGIVQKGVDMRIGIDIATLVDVGLVNQIILIAGDSDLVPALKLARRSGIDVILDPMWNGIRPSLEEHVDAVQTMCPRLTFVQRQRAKTQHVADLQDPSANPRPSRADRDLDYSKIDNDLPADSKKDVDA